MFFINTVTLFGFYVRESLCWSGFPAASDDRGKMPLPHQNYKNDVVVFIFLKLGTGESRSADNISILRTG
jgi:hypothetical protein